MAWNTGCRSSGDSLITRAGSRRSPSAGEGLLRLGVLVRAFERHAHARGDRRQQPNFGLAVRLLALVVPEHDRARHAVAGDDRDLHRRTRAPGARHDVLAPGGRLGGRVHYHRRPAASSTRIGCRSVRTADRRRVTALAALHLVEEADLVRRLVEPVDGQVGDAEDRAPSPTRSTMPWKLGSAATACWMRLITASSSARCLSSAVRSATLTSSPAAKRRLASATAACAASIDSRSRSAS